MDVTWTLIIITVAAAAGGVYAAIRSFLRGDASSPRARLRRDLFNRAAAVLFMTAAVAATVSAMRGRQEHFGFSVIWFSIGTIMLTRTLNARQRAELKAAMLDAERDQQQQRLDELDKQAQEYDLPPMPRVGDGKEPA